MVGLQILFIKVCSKMHGLPYEVLVASATGCNMKIGLRNPRSGLIKEYYLTRTPTVEYALQLLFYEIFCLVHGLARRGFSGLRRAAWD